MERKAQSETVLVHTRTVTRNRHSSHLSPFGLSTLETTRRQYRHGLSNPEQRVAPEAILLDQALLDRPQINALVTRLESLT